MIVTCVLVGSIIRMAGGVNARAALKRDVSVYMVAICGLLITLAAGKVGEGSVGKGDGFFRADGAIGRHRRFKMSPVYFLN